MASLSERHGAGEHFLCNINSDTKEFNGKITSQAFIFPPFSVIHKFCLLSAADNATTMAMNGWVFTKVYVSLLLLQLVTQK